MRFWQQWGLSRAILFSTLLLSTHPSLGAESAHMHLMGLLGMGIPFFNQGVSFGQIGVANSQLAITKAGFFCRKQTYPWSLVGIAEWDLSIPSCPSLTQVVMSAGIWSATSLHVNVYTHPELSWPLLISGADLTLATPLPTWVKRSNPWLQSLSLFGFLGSLQGSVIGGGGVQWKLGQSITITVAIGRHYPTRLDNHWITLQMSGLWSLFYKAPPSLRRVLMGAFSGRYSSGLIAATDRTIPSAAKKTVLNGATNSAARSRTALALTYFEPVVAGKMLSVNGCLLANHRSAVESHTQIITPSMYLKGSSIYRAPDCHRNASGSVTEKGARGNQVSHLSTQGDRLQGVENSGPPPLVSHHKITQPDPIGRIWLRNCKKISGGNPLSSHPNWVTPRSRESDNKQFNDRRARYRSRAVQNIVSSCHKKRPIFSQSQPIFTGVPTGTVKRLVETYCKKQKISPHPCFVRRFNLDTSSDKNRIDSNARLYSIESTSTGDLSSPIVPLSRFREPISGRDRHKKLNRV